ncbi:hypothetical protein EIN_497570 [Entamoeba invadens IP1]|uniref:Uncharacterized protein n=1 Tax=Entamoeba invadens IP1 TaxID=370355 RepID=A0A0A1UDG3_ENTIV|nr:hypothetical protein EIN_497570 [Entamoeba invadens IP1]ELP94597.1 hypothetical protein EIN_497570 [Entamoeba invadens IP1]|eukprot:XP_004261368.1 hypothetical protein EIN_497570 [Entamoeba invadens IP1]
MKRHQSVFQDKRKAKKQLTQEEVRVKQWFNERARQKKDIFNINNDDEQEETFTHGGESLSTTKYGYIDVPENVDQDVEAEQVDLQTSNRPDTRGRYEIMIENSKMRKEEKRVQRDQQETRLDYLDKNLDEVYSIANPRQRGDDNEGDDYAILLQKMISDKTRSTADQVEQDTEEARIKKIQLEVSNIKERNAKIFEGAFLSRHKVSGNTTEEFADVDDMLGKIEDEDIVDVIYKIGDGYNWGAKVDDQETLAKQAGIVLDGVEELGVLKATQGLQAFVGEILNRREEMMSIVIDNVFQSVHWEEDEKTIKQLAVLMRVWSTSDFGSMILMKIMDFLGGLFTGIAVGKRLPLQCAGAILLSEVCETKFLPEFFKFLREAFELVKEAKTGELVKFDSALNLEGEELKGYAKRVVIEIVTRIVKTKRTENTIRNAIFKIVDEMREIDGCETIIAEWDKSDEDLGFTFTIVPRTPVPMIRMFNPRINTTDLLKERKEVKKKLKKETRKAQKNEEIITDHVVKQKQHEENIQREKQKKAYGLIINELQQQANEVKEMQYQSFAGPDKFGRKNKKNFRKKIKY